MPQLLLTPVLYEPEREEAAVLLENAELLAQYGYEHLGLRRRRARHPPDPHGDRAGRRRADV